MQGEKQVISLLSRNLSDDYYLINGLYLHGGGGDIDHIVLAPAGIFVLETKNWSGTIQTKAKSGNVREKAFQVQALAAKLNVTLRELNR